MIANTTTSSFTTWVTSPSLEHQTLNQETTHIHPPLLRIRHHAETMQNTSPYLKASPHNLLTNFHIFSHTNPHPKPSPHPKTATIYQKAYTQLPKPRWIIDALNFYFRECPQLQVIHNGPTFSFPKKSSKRKWRSLGRPQHI